MTEVCEPAFDLLVEAAKELNDANAHCKDEEAHRRGPFRALASGISFGGGQRVCPLIAVPLLSY
jgi:hypothetical protein